MGQFLNKLQDLEQLQGSGIRKPRCDTDVVPTRFRDLNELPPELGLLVLSHLNATDLCLAGCVWKNLGNDDFLWQGLCRSQWGYVSIYMKKKDPTFSYKKLYLQLDEATLTFNAEPELGFEYLVQNGLLDDVPMDVAKFLHTARNVDREKLREFLTPRKEVLAKLVELQNFENQFLPNALRKFFYDTRPPNDRGSYLHVLVDQFSGRFCKCNPKLGLSKDTVYVLCFSLIMLSVDLSSPHVKNKMSKREFIKNTRRAAVDLNEDFAGHLYDNIYLRGHIAPKA